jgi:hypothetical protein
LCLVASLLGEPKVKYLKDQYAAFRLCQEGQRRMVKNEVDWESMSKIDFDKLADKDFDNSEGALEFSGFESN